MSSIDFYYSFFFVFFFNHSAFCVEFALNVNPDLSLLIFWFFRNPSISESENQWEEKFPIDLMVLIVFFLIYLSLIFPVFL